MYQFDTTPTEGSTNPVTSDGISAVIKKKCSIVSEITVAEQTNLFNPVDRGIYIKENRFNINNSRVWLVLIHLGSCLLPHLFIYYKDSDGIFKHTPFTNWRNKSYTSITISSKHIDIDSKMMDQ